MCPGTTDFKVAAEGTFAFKDLGPCEIVGYTSCGGCPGKRAATRAKMMVERGAEAIAFASCIKKGNPIGFPCPHYAQMIESARKKLGEAITVIEWTH